MDGVLRALEVAGTVDEHHQLHLDTPLPIAGPSRVRVIVLLADDTEVDEREWLHLAGKNPAFDFLREPKEDIYTLDDGEPFRDAG